jgi:type III pantothenate kinase
MIIPGLRVSLDSLTTRTSQLPKISLDPPKKVIGSNTVDCMKSGIIYSTAASIDGVVERIEEEMGEQCTVISTGGLARKIIPYCKRDIIIDDQLLLKGLMLIYHKNKS